MSFLKNTYKRRAFLTTLLVHLLLVLVFYSFGLKYMDPKIEEGIAFEFGYFDQGMGNEITQSEEIQTEIIEVIQEVQASLSIDDTEIVETILTQDIDAVEVAVEVKDEVQTEEPNKLEKVVEKVVETESLSSLNELDPNRDKIISGGTGVGVSMAPVVYKNKVIIGITGVGYGLHIEEQGSDSPLGAVVGVAGRFGRPGFLAAYDIHSGRQVWQFDTIPEQGWEGKFTNYTGDGEVLNRDTYLEKEALAQYPDSAKYGGGSAWTTPAIDEITNTLFFGTGNPSPQMSAETRPGDNLYTVSLVALDADTGKLDWVEPWQLIDMNNDGHIDIAGSRTADENYNNAPIVYFNDGKGRFEIAEIGSEIADKGRPYAYSDFDNDNYLKWTAISSDKIDYELKPLVKGAGRLGELVDWCDDNCNGIYVIGKADKIYFEDENDAAMFALVWK